MTTSHLHAPTAGKPLIRPAWTPATIGLMVLGFFAFWPLGLAMLAYILWGDRLDGLKRDVNRATDGVMSRFRSASGSASGLARSNTGNLAFDEWRTGELERLDEERARLEAMHAEFEDYARELRRAKDKEEFDRFMAHRRNSSREADRTVGDHGQNA